jgi:hypothetical protein
MLHHHPYETIMLFLTGVGIGIYVYGLRRFYHRIHPSRRPERQADTTKAKKPATRSV